MLRDPSSKYSPFPVINLPDRQWPSHAITRAPRWLSTDMRDGNQALANPMDAAKKRQFFELLVKIGFTEIEIGFPSASSTEFGFIRQLVTGNDFPITVVPQVLTQSRQDLIARTFDSLDGTARAAVHLYNAISPAWRRIVFGMDRAAIKNIAVTGMTMLRQEAERRPRTDWQFEYSPETFSTTELDFSLEVCEAVIDVIEPTPANPLILNLPATVEAATPNVYADQIEWFGRHISRRDSIILSVHPHNDRGTGVAAAELAVMAGADRIEGCLFGNGERTGNVDLVTLALNLYTQGIDPGLDFSDIDTVVRTVEYCNELPVHPRHPYAGGLVFTAFSGSHQDAIRKGFAAQAKRNDELWDVPYLPIDPADLGKNYEAVIRVNSQSGKGGVAWVLEQDKGLRLPKRMQADFSQHVQALADQAGRELDAADIWDAFEHAYRLVGAQRFALIDFMDSGTTRASGSRRFTGRVGIDGEIRTISGHGNGLISGLLAALRDTGGFDLDVIDFQEHAIGHGAGASAAAYLECRSMNGSTAFGVGIDEDIATASVKAVLSATNNLFPAS